MIHDDLVDCLVDATVYNNSGPTPPEYPCHALNGLSAAYRADISNGEHHGHCEFVEMDLVNFSGGVQRGRADLCDFPTGQREEVAVVDGP